DLSSGNQRLLSSQKWVNKLVKDDPSVKMVWLSDGSGLLLAAQEQFEGRPYQIWNVSYPEGETRRITNDLNSYLTVSLTSDSQNLVTVHNEGVTSVLIIPGGETA